MKKSILLLLSIVLTSTTLISQTAIEIEKGDKAFDNLNFDEALYFYEVALEQSPNDPKIAQRLAKTYKRIGQMAVSAEWYRKSIDLGSSDPLDMLSYAEALKSLGQYDEAVVWYERYSEFMPDDLRAKSHLADRDYYEDLFADTLKYDMKSMAMNNVDPVISITEFENNNYLLSAINAERKSNEDGKIDYLQYLDVYVVELTPENELVSPIRLDENVNSKYHDGPAFFSFSNSTVYISRTNIRRGKPVLDKTGSANTKILTSKYENGVWKPAKELNINSDDYSNTHPTLTKDGQFLYFVSNRPGGFGGTDLYVSQKIGEEWSEPINLGDNVNTEGNEMFPYIGNDGSLYFASDGIAGLGGLDIFQSRNEGGKWQTPINLGAPINSSSDDFSLMYDKHTDKGFFCSNRNGRGNDDIFFYTHKKLEKTILAGTIRTNTPNVSLAGEKIRVSTKNTGLNSEYRLDANESFQVSADPGDEIEVFMMDATYFDTEKPIFSTTIESPIIDPFIDLGEEKLGLKNIPLRTGRLIDIKGDEISLAPKPSLLDQINAQNAEKNISEEERLAEEKKLAEERAAANKTKLEMEFNESIKKADEAFAALNWKDALKNYQDALAINPTSTYAKSKISETNAKIKEYFALITAGDKLAKAKNYGDARAKYEAAIALDPHDKIAKEKLYELNLAEKNANDAAELKRLENERKKATADSLAKAEATSSVGPKIDYESAQSIIDLETRSLDNVQFDFNKAFVREYDKAKLDTISQILKDNPDTKILIKAFCDSRGSMTYNLSLSMSRAMAVQGYLIQKGIPRKRIQAEWYGETRPLNECEDGVPCTEDQYEINRRAEFKIVAFKSGS